jgi:thiamine pyrophosphokinase
MQGVEVYKYPPEKDETDAGLALFLCKEKCVREAHIVGATGGRLDHFLANIGILYRALCDGISYYIIDDYSCMYMKDRSFKVRKRDYFDKYISFMSYTDEVCGLSLSGFKYPLSDFTLVKESDRCISNEFIEPEGEVIFKSGILIVIESVSDRDKRITGTEELYD